MTALNKQTLREELEVCSKDRMRRMALALLDELEATQKTSEARRNAILRTHNMFQKQRERAEASEKRIAELKIALDKCFLSGLKTGWEYGIADDTEGYNREIADAQAVIDRAAGIQVIEGEQKNG